MVHRRSSEKLQDRFLHFLTYFDDEQKEVVNLKDAVRLQLHQYRKGYKIKFMWLEEPVEVGEVLMDKRGRGSLQNNPYLKEV